MVQQSVAGESGPKRRCMAVAVAVAETAAETQIVVVADAADVIALLVARLCRLQVAVPDVCDPDKRGGCGDLSGCLTDGR